MSAETVRTFRIEAAKQILREKRLPGVLFCNAIRENWDTWLTGSTELPTLQPFGRLNLFLVTAEGEVHGLCAFTNHPCDFPHYPLFESSHYPDLFGDGRMGIVNPECLLKYTRDDIAEHYPNLQWEDLTSDFLRAKACKGPEEISGVENAARIYDRAFTLMPWLLKAGETERQIVVELQRRLGTLGAETPMLSEDPNATTLVTLTTAPQVGPSVEEPLAYPGRRLQIGDRVNLAVTSYLNGGYAGAMGRCYVMGEANEETKHWWDLPVYAQHRLAELLVPGTTIRLAVSQMVQEVLVPNGIDSAGENCVYGIGCSRSEAPRYADATRDMELAVGMTLVVAPKLTLPGQDPYCCMDVYRITEQGAVRLSRTSQQLREFH